jgi:hypothetical protein
MNTNGALLNKEINGKVYHILINKINKDLIKIINLFTLSDCDINVFFEEFEKNTYYLKNVMINKFDNQCKYYHHVKNTIESPRSGFNGSSNFWYYKLR